MEEYKNIIIGLLDELPQVEPEDLLDAQWSILDHFQTYIKYVIQYPDLVNRIRAHIVACRASNAFRAKHSDFVDYTEELLEFVLAGGPPDNFQLEAPPHAGNANN